MPKDTCKPDGLSGGFVGATEVNAKPDTSIDPDHLARLADRDFPSIAPNDQEKYPHLGM